jgi:Na+/H+-dicarboxylate symporter
VNLIGNGVATLVVSRMEGAFDERQRELAMLDLKKGGASP